MKNRILVVIVFTVTIDLAYAQSNLADPNCNVLPALSGDELAAVGDSRAQQFVYDVYEILDSNNNRNKSNGIANAVNNVTEKKIIIKENQINLIDRAKGGSTTEDWLGFLNGCSAFGGHFALPNKVWISIGGNDVLSFFQKREEYKTKWKPKSSQMEANSKLSMDVGQPRFNTQRKRKINESIQSGLMTLEEVRTKWENEANKSGRVINENQSKGNIFGSYAFWDWNANSHVDVITQNAIRINERILNDNPNAKVLMNTAAPVSFPSSQYMLDLLFSNPSKFNDHMIIGLNYVPVYSMFIKLWIRYYVRLFPRLSARYFGRFIFLDTAEYFSRNILTAWASLYKEDTIHFNLEGNKVFGRFMAIEMVKAGWYEAGPGYIGNSVVMKFYDDIEVSLHHLALTAKGIVSGLNGSSLADRPVIFHFDKGFKKEFPEINSVSYIKYDSDEPYILSGLFLSKYRQLGEANSELGFPTSDPYRIYFDTIDKVNFECGYIDHNRLELTDLNNTHVHITSNACRR